jgi:aminopeptidase C
MLITGVQLEDNKPVRWKVENTHTEHQFFVMNDNFFDAYLTNIAIYSDFLSQIGIPSSN